MILQGFFHYGFDLNMIQCLYPFLVEEKIWIVNDIILIENISNQIKIRNESFDQAPRYVTDNNYKFNRGENRWRSFKKK